MKSNFRRGKNESDYNVSQNITCHVESFKYFKKSLSDSTRLFIKENTSCRQLRTWQKTWRVLLYKK